MTNADTNALRIAYPSFATIILDQRRITAGNLDHRVNHLPCSRSYGHHSEGTGICRLLPDRAITSTKRILEPHRSSDPEDRSGSSQAGLSNSAGQSSGRASCSRHRLGSKGTHSAILLKPVPRPRHGGRRKSPPGSPPIAGTPRRAPRVPPDRSSPAPAPGRRTMRRRFDRPIGWPTTVALGRWRRSSSTSCTRVGETPRRSPIRGAGVRCPALPHWLWRPAHRYRRSDRSAAGVDDGSSSRSRRREPQSRLRV